jgi:hypothetical protein
MRANRLDQSSYIMYLGNKKNKNDFYDEEFDEIDLDYEEFDEDFDYDDFNDEFDNDDFDDIFEKKR